MTTYTYISADTPIKGYRRRCPRLASGRNCRLFPASATPSSGVTPGGRIRRSVARAAPGGAAAATGPPGTHGRSAGLDQTDQNSRKVVWGAQLPEGGVGCITPGGCCSSGKQWGRTGKAGLPWEYRLGMLGTICAYAKSKWNKNVKR